MTFEGANALTDAVKAEAKRLGFALVGVTTPDPPPHLAVFARWLEQGHQAGMTYLASERSRQRRADPRRILPECRSILLLGALYAPASAEPPESGRGRVAAYAWGEDYHQVLLPRLEALAAFIESKIEEPLLWKAYTDTGPLLERDLAQRAGLGWIGKNTCLINPQLGSYFFLAELLLNVQLAPDAPFTSDRCGSCTRCIEACPTACILPDRTLDAERCISYLTIENKGAIPPELRESIGGWVFGCDVCQIVCPWNVRFAPRDPEAIDPAFRPAPGTPRPDLRAELHLSREEFNHRFKRSPLRRARRQGYLRNVAVALGNAGDPAAVPDLGQALLGESEPLVRAHAAWALGRIGGRQAHALLEQAAQVESDPQVQEEIQSALAMEPKR